MATRPVQQPDPSGETVILETLQHLHAIELPTPYPVGPVTVYLCDAPGEPLSLFDAGPHTAEAQAALEAGLAHFGYRTADLERIVISHAHADHFGLAAHLAAASGAEILSHSWNDAALGDHQADRERRVTFYASLLQQAAVPAEMMIAIGQATRGVNRFAQPVGIDLALKEGDQLRLAGRRWQVLHTPGHAAGLICLYEPASRTLLSSDHLLADISSNPVVEPPPPGQTERLRSLALYVASLQRVATMDIAVALPSHGPVIHDVASLVQERLSFHRQRMERILDALHNGARTTWEVTHALFPERSPLDTFLAISEVIGHLDLLEMEGSIEGEQTNGVIVWELLALPPGEGDFSSRR
jgi:glyoxylase-like metal-dependent hydrolase (beta-lactamase superfamily II)